MRNGKINYSQFTCQVCGVKSEMYEADAPEIKDGLPPGWEFLYDHAVCSAHFDLVATTVKRALDEVVKLLRPATEGFNCHLITEPLIHGIFLAALDREEKKILVAKG